jgi:hypothetical protein
MGRIAFAALCACLGLANMGAASAADRSDRDLKLRHQANRDNAAAPSEEQRAMLTEKIAIANRLYASVTNGKETSADYRIWLMESMYRVPLADLRAIGNVTGPDAIVRAVTKSAKTTAKLGAASTELVYYPIQPCRYIDTRNTGGPLVQGTPRPFDLANTGSTYGGSAACNPKAAVGGNEDAIGALAANVTIVSPTVAPGFVGARPAGATGSTSLVNWYQAGASVQAANAGVITTDQNPANANEIEFFGSPTQFIVDVFGVFAAPTATALDCTNGTETQVVLNTTTRYFNLAADVCPGGYVMVSNSCQAQGDYQSGALVLAGGGTTFGGSNCLGYYSGTSTVTVLNAPWCCRMPGR